LAINTSLRCSSVEEFDQFECIIDKGPTVGKTIEWYPELEVGLYEWNRGRMLCPLDIF